MPVINKSSCNFHQWAADKVYSILRSQRIGKKRAMALAKVVVGIAGPGVGHRGVNYRVSPSKGGWWMTEMVGADAHDDPVQQTHFVPEAAVKRLWRIVKKLVPVSAKYRLSTNADQVPYDYRFGLQHVASVLCRKKLLWKERGRLDLWAIGGGTNRAKYYFPLYLYPMRVLDFLGRIRFGKTSWRLE